MNVEFIESYIHDDSGDYKWNDNHGELIRCKDCKYSSPNGVYGCRLERYNFNDESVRMYADDYCSYGERRTDGEEVH